jgi:hypothetical protein
MTIRHQTMPAAGPVNREREDSLLRKHNSYQIEIEIVLWTWTEHSAKRKAKIPAREHGRTRLLAL